MTETTMDKARLAAFVDGELEPEDAAAVVMHLADHPADQAYVDGLMTLNETLGAAYDAPMREPVPEPILSTIEPARDAPNVTPFRTRTSGPRVAAWVGGAALAAGIAAFAVFSPSTTGSFLAPGPLEGRSAVAEALDQLSTGEARFVAKEVEMLILASFAAPDRGVCREFELIYGDGAVHDHAVACPAAASGWTIEVVEAVELAAPDLSFTVASGEAGDAVNAFIDQIGGGAALSADEENAARAADWRP
ncbi:MAG: zf-HC2 domain-containing protein [Pseudomonadota bacterium]